MQKSWIQLMSWICLLISLVGCNSNLHIEDHMDASDPRAHSSATDQPSAVEHAEAEWSEDDPAAQLAKRLGKTYEIVKSPNKNERKYRDPATGERTGDLKPPTILLLHYTACEKEGVLVHFMKKDSVSAHYLVDREGNITRFVEEGRRAWHAGYGSWKGETDVNTRSIGVENVNLGYKHQLNHPPGIQIGGSSEEWYRYDEPLLKTLAELCKDIIKRYHIKPDNVIGHSDMAVDPQTHFLGRKVDPGPLFPWERFYKEYGIGAWYDLKNPLQRVQLFKGDDDKVKWTQTHLLKYGYACPQTSELDEGTKRAIKAFQMHFRPTNISGEIDEETITILAHLVDRYIEKGEHKRPFSCWGFICGS